MMKIKNTLLIILFLTLFLNLSYSQTTCTSDVDCSLLTAPCVKEYTCNLETSECEPVMKECENGIPCTDFCVSSELECQNRSCIASADPEIDSKCNINYWYECPEAPTLCQINLCYPNEGCKVTTRTCDDEDGCTVDSCTLEEGCKFEPIENCDFCFYFGCVTTDACFPSVCYLFDGQGNPYPFDPNPNARQGGLTRDGMPYSECREVPKNCTTDDPCIYAYCKDGECHFEDICSSENPTTTGAVTISQTTTGGGETVSATTTGGGETTDFTITGGQTIDYTIHNTYGHSIHHTFTGGHTHGQSIHNTIHQTISSGNSEEYIGPKYPNCLNCEDLNCESMGRHCKYLKSVDSTCWDDDNNKNKHPNKDNKVNNNQHNQHNNHDNQHHNQHNNNNNQQQQQHHSNHFNNKIEQDGGYGGIIKNIHKKYPSKLGIEDCCPYTPTCY